jgi:hypothetical protein
MADPAPFWLDTALGNYPRTRALLDGVVRSPLLTLQFAELSTT